MKLPVEQGTVRLTSMQQVVYRLFFEEGMLQREIAAVLRISRQAVTCRVAGIRARYERSGLEPPASPGRDLVTLGTISLTGSEWAV